MKDLEDLGPLFGSSRRPRTSIWPPVRLTLGRCQIIRIYLEYISPALFEPYTYTLNEYILKFVILSLHSLTLKIGLEKSEQKKITVYYWYIKFSIYV